MSIDEQHIALPKLYGAPAYGRPPRPAVGEVRPFDPDELPIEAYRTSEEQEFVETLPAQAFAPGGTVLQGNGHSETHGSGIRARSLSLRSITGRFRTSD